MKRTAALVALCGLAEAAERPQFVAWRGMHGLGHQPHERAGPEGRRLHEHDYSHYHPETGKTELSYIADVADHVVFLDEDLSLLGLECGEDWLSLRFAEGVDAASVVSAWPEDAFLVGGPQWECWAAHVERSGDVAPDGHVVFRHVEGLKQAQGSAATVQTTNGTFADAFHSMHTSFRWAPPHHDHPDPFAARDLRHGIAQDVRARHEADLAGRRLALDDDLQTCVDMTSWDVTGDFTTDCVIDMSEAFDFYSDMFSLNWDPVAAAPVDPLIEALDETLYCEDCVIASNVIIEAQIDVDNFDLESLLVQATGTVRATATLVVHDPVGMAEEYLERAFESVELGGCMSTIKFMIGYVPVLITPCWDLRFEGENSEPYTATIRTGFLFDASATVGISYTDAGGWEPVKEWDWEYQYAQPYFSTDVDNDVSTRFYVVPAISFVLYELVPVEVLAKPYVGIEFRQQDAEVVLADSETDGTWRLELMTIDSEDQLIDDRDLIFTIDMNICGDPSAGDSSLYDTSLCHAVSDQFDDVNSEETVNYVFNLDGLRLFDFEAVLDTGFHIAIDDGGTLSEHIGDIDFAGCDITQFSTCIEEFAVNGVDFVMNITFAHGVTAVSEGLSMFTDLFGDGDSCGVESFIDSRRRLELAAGGHAAPPQHSALQQLHRDVLMRDEKRRLSDACPATVHLNYGMIVEAAIGEIELRYFDDSFLSDLVWDSFTDIHPGTTLGSFVAIPTTDLTCLSCEGCTTVLDAATAEYAETLLPDELVSASASDDSLSASNIAALVMLPLSAAAMFALGVLATDHLGGSSQTTPRAGAGTPRKAPSCAGFSDCLPSIGRPRFARRAGAGAGGKKKPAVPPPRAGAAGAGGMTTNPWAGVLKKGGQGASRV